MSTLAEICRKESERLARERKEDEMKSCIIASLPDLPYYEHIHGFGAISDGSVKITVNNGTQLIEVYKALPPIEMIKHLDSCLSFLPRERITKEKEMNITDISPFYYEMEYMNCKTTSTFIWFTKLNGIVVKVEVSLVFNFLTQGLPDVKRIDTKDLRGVITESRLEVTTGLINSGTRIKIGNSDYSSGRFYFYWVESETDNLENLIPTFWLNHEGEIENLIPTFWLNHEGENIQI